MDQTNTANSPLVSSPNLAKTRKGGPTSGMQTSTVATSTTAFTQGSSTGRDNSIFEQSGEETHDLMPAEIVKSFGLLIIQHSSSQDTSYTANTEEVSDNDFADTLQPRADDHALNGMGEIGQNKNAAKVFLIFYFISHRMFSAYLLGGSASRQKAYTEALIGTGKARTRV